jgi:hypothetical protein
LKSFDGRLVLPTSQNDLRLNFSCKAAVGGTATQLAQQPQQQSSSWLYYTLSRFKPKCGTALSWLHDIKRTK